MAMEWTDEKHNVYLKSMEASFVNDLYNSFDSIKSTSSGQFKVLQHGCWEKINFERNISQSEKAKDPDVLLTNPWIRHFKSSNLREKVALAADLSSYDSTEFTDQNFVDEEDIGDGTSHTTDTSKPKRIKIEKSVDPITINDLLVPLAKFSEFADVIHQS